jgi:MFS family permease
VTGPERPRAELAAVVAEGFFSRLSFGLVTFGVPLYALRLGMSLAEIGLLTSFNLVVAIVLKPAMGWVADRMGLKPSLTVAITLRSLVGMLLIFAQSPWQLFAIRGVHGLSTALRDPAMGAIIAEVGGKKAVASSFAWYQTGKSAAGSMGKALAGLLLAVTASSFPILFGAALVLSVVPLMVVVKFVRRDDRMGSANEEAAGPDVLTLTKGEAPHHLRATASSPRGTLAIAGLGFLVSGTAYMMANLFPVLATEYAGLTEGETGAIYLIGTLVALSGPLWGWLSDHVSQGLVLSIRGIANVCSSVLYLVSPSFLGLAAGRALDDTGKAAFRPAWGALMAHAARSDRERRARIMAYLSAGEDAGEVAGPIVAGLLWSAWGVPVVMVARILLALATEFYAILFTRSLPRKRATTRLVVQPGPGRLTAPVMASVRLRQ